MTSYQPSNPPGKFPPVVELEELFSGYTLINRRHHKSIITFTANEDSSGKQVSIQLIPQSIIGSQEDVNQRIDYAQKLAHIDHPNLIRILEVGGRDHFMYLITEFVDGISLNDLLLGKLLSQRQTIDIALDITSALNCLHDAQAYHKAIRPSNVLITSNGIKITPPEMHQLSNFFNSISGLEDILYAAPEIVLHQRGGACADVFSVGVLIMKCLTGLSPDEYSQADESRQRLMGDLNQIIMRSIQLEPINRYASIMEMRNDLIIQQRKIKDNTPASISSMIA